MPQPLTRSTVVMSVAFAVAALVLVWTIASQAPRTSVPPEPLDLVGRTQTCRAEIYRSLGLDKGDPDTWEQVSNICYMQVRGEALLADFNIRRSNLINQQAEGRIVLWMVVAITISGVLLAGLQLLAAYRLAGSGKGELAVAQEIVLEQNKVSLKSSVTGLLILVISFAFFMVYIMWVYTAKELRQETPEAATSRPAAVPNLGSIGGFGPVPPSAGTTTPPPASPASPAPKPGPASSP
jgi:hypothetical protein